MMQHLVTGEHLLTLGLESPEGYFYPLAAILGNANLENLRPVCKDGTADMSAKPISAAELRAKQQSQD